MKLAEIIKSVGLDQKAESITIFRHFPKECEVILRVYHNGDIIFRENDSIAYVGILVQGRFSCSWEISGRDDYVHISQEPPAMMGDQAALAGLPRYTGTFRAIGNCKVVLVRLPDFWLWMERDIGLYKNTVARHIRILLEQCQTRRSTVVERANIRVVKYLVWYCHLKGRPVGKELPHPVTIRVTRDTMTELIGKISLRTVNRILSQLEEEGLISITRGKVLIGPEQYRLLIEMLEADTGEV